MLPAVKRVLIVVAIAATGVFASLGTAQAATGTARLTSAAASPDGCCAPTSKIEGTGKALKFVPKTVTAAPVAGTCSSTEYSFLVVNETKATQHVTYMGSPYGPALPPKQRLYLCFSSAGVGTLSLTKDPKAKLKFTIT